MAKRKPAQTDPGVLSPAAPEPPSVVADDGDVVIVLATEHYEPLRHATIAKAALGVTVVVDRQAYMHVANDRDGRWIFVPTK